MQVCTIACWCSRTLTFQLAWQHWNFVSNLCRALITASSIPCPNLGKRSENDLKIWVLLLSLRLSSSRFKNQNSEIKHSEFEHSEFALTCLDRVYGKMFKSRDKMMTINLTRLECSSIHVALRLFDNLMPGALHELQSTDWIGIAEYSKLEDEHCLGKFTICPSIRAVQRFQSEWLCDVREKRLDWVLHKLQSRWFVQRSRKAERSNFISSVLRSSIHSEWVRQHIQRRLPTFLLQNWRDQPKRMCTPYILQIDQDRYMNEGRRISARTS